MSATTTHRFPPTARRLLESKRRIVDAGLRRLLPRAGAQPPVIHQAMRYSVLAGGKRLRGALVLAAAELVGGRQAEILPAACAIECIHAYSLIHDDLPAMDNAATRRGKPSCHRRYGEAVAILAGDALLSLGFELLARGNHAPRRLQALGAVARVSGTDGLIGGQVMDLAWQRKPVGGARALEYINANKTAKLIAVSAEIGARLGGGTAAEVRALERYGFELGLAFQLTDDVLDRDGLAAVLGIDAARAAAQRCAASARRHLRRFGARAVPLQELADAIVWRTT